MNSLPLVKEFITESAPKFQLKVDYVGGDPRLIFYDEEDHEAEKVDITRMNSAQIIEELNKRGFYESGKSGQKGDSNKGEL